MDAQSSVGMFECVQILFHTSSFTHTPHLQTFANTPCTHAHTRTPQPGFEEDVDKVGRREIEAFFAANYTPSRLTLAVVGDVDPGKARQYAETYWGGWQPQGVGTLVPTTVGTGNGVEQDV